MIDAVRKAARGLTRDFGEVAELQVSKKGAGDYVSAADIKAEQVLFEELMRVRPGYGFIGEERGLIEGSDKTHTWIVDPLDGTTNFLHAIPHFAVTAALERDGVIVAGVTYNPISNEMFWAEKGVGAFLNDKRLRVSGRKDMREALFATGIPFGGVARKAEFSTTLNKLMPQVAGVRRFGAAALDLAWVAAGRYDGFWELGLKPWDIAAGLVLVREAGGFVSDPDGNDPYPSGMVVCGNPTLQPKLREVVAEGIAAVKAHQAAG
jgi:myo-inositol-1(or 4)-monophosphatase